MTLKKLTAGTSIVILSTGLLLGCGNTDNEQEPEPEETPTEQQQNNNDNSPDNTKGPAEKQHENIQDKEDQYDKDREDIDDFFGEGRQ